MIVEDGYLFRVVQGGLSDSLILNRGLKEETARHDDNCRKGIPGAPQRVVYHTGDTVMKPVWARQRGKGMVVGGDTGEALGSRSSGAQVPAKILDFTLDKRRSQYRVLNKSAGNVMDVSVRIVLTATLRICWENLCIQRWKQGVQ